MKTLTFLLSLLFLYGAGNAQQLKTFVDSYSGVTTLSTDFDTLNTVASADKSAIADRVVGVRNIHKGESKYWLFFYFSTSDITQKTVSISKKNFAYFVLNNNVYQRYPYSGRAGTYASKDNAGFFIDITNSINNLKSSKIKLIRFETSTLYHEIKIPESGMSKIADIVNRLIE